MEIFDRGNKAKKGEKGKQKTMKNNAKTLSGLLAYMLKKNHAEKVMQLSV